MFVKILRMIYMDLLVHVEVSYWRGNQIIRHMHQVIYIPHMTCPLFIHIQILLGVSPGILEIYRKPILLYKYIPGCGMNATMKYRFLILDDISLACIAPNHTVRQWYTLKSDVLHNSSSWLSFTTSTLNLNDVIETRYNHKMNVITGSKTADIREEVIHQDCISWITQQTKTFL